MNFIFKNLVLRSINLIFFLNSLRACNYFNPNCQDKHAIKPDKDAQSFGGFSASNYAEAYFVQKLDHFNHDSDVSWSQRYWENSDSYTGSGPIFLFIGQLNPADPSWFNYYFYNWAKLGQQYNALLFVLETRFYGTSRPTLDLSDESLSYLSLEQILADAAYFRNFMVKKKNLNSTQKWIVFGGSTGGSYAALLRAKYSDLFFGAYAYSGQIKPVVNYQEYFETVGNVIKKIDSECYREINHATSELDKLVKKKEYNQITYILNSCYTIQSESDAINLISWQIPWAFANEVQYYIDFSIINKMREENSYFINKILKNFENQTNKLSFGAVWDIYLIDSQSSKIPSYCSIMKNKTIGNTLERYKALNDFLNGGASTTLCSNSSYANSISFYNLDRSWDSTAATRGKLQVFYQQCSQLLNFLTSDSRNQPFGNFFPLDFALKQCNDIFNGFDLHYQKKFQHKYMKDYHKILESSSRIILTNGGFDPWHKSSSYQKKISSETYSIFIKGGSHCVDLYTNDRLPNEPTQLIKARNKAEEILKKWLK